VVCVLSGRAAARRSLGGDYTVRVCRGNGEVSQASQVLVRVAAGGIVTTRLIAQLLRLGVSRQLVGTATAVPLLLFGRCPPAALLHT
jgi:hypothetical protein